MFRVPLSAHVFSCVHSPAKLPGTESRVLEYYIVLECSSARVPGYEAGLADHGILGVGKLRLLAKQGGR